MRRKRPAAPEVIALPSETIVPDALIEDARKLVEAGRSEKAKPCVVCGEETAPTSSEGLCWVCRRLKFSAWRDADTQMPAQE